MEESLSGTGPPYIRTQYSDLEDLENKVFTEKRPKSLTQSVQHAFKDFSDTIKNR
jgi:hypothetical protein